MLQPPQSTLKRKATIEDDGLGELVSRKLPNIDGFKPNRTLTNLNLNSSLPKPLTKPRAPTLMTSKPRIRGTSAPPQSASGSLARPLSKASGIAKKEPPARAVSGPVRVIQGDDNDQRFNAIQSQLSSIESARAADAARLVSILSIRVLSLKFLQAAEMQTEKAKLTKLQHDHVALSRELAAAKDQEISHRRELSNASDEIANLKKVHAMETLDLEMSLKKRDREIREASEDLRLAREDLERERQTVSTLKSTISQQANSHVTLNTEIHSLQAQNNALQTQIDIASRTISELRFNLEAAEMKVTEMKQEVIDGEMTRRKLHNMVQELKGNIRVFCRVRPILLSDAEASLQTGSEEFENFKNQAQASINFPDQRDHKEIILMSSSESATGQERKETHNFSFDRVCSLCILFSWPTLFHRYLNPDLHRKRFSKKSQCSLKAVPMDTTSAFSHTDKLAVANHLLWKAGRYA